MEEDKCSTNNPSSHPFRQYLHHQILPEANASSQLCNNQKYAVLPGSLTQGHANPLRCYQLRNEALEQTYPFLEQLIQSTATPASSETTVNQVSDGNSVRYHCARGMVAVNNYIRGMVAVEDDGGHCLSSCSSCSRRRRNQNQSKNCTTDGDANISMSTNRDRMHFVRGMTAIEEDVDLCCPTVNNNTKISNGSINSNKTQDGGDTAESNAHKPPTQQRYADHSNRFLEEVNGLFHDYRRRFYRQSLTDRAKELLDRAANHALCSDQASKLVLCTEALNDCKYATRDQIEALHGDERNHVGGSYLVTGDIRIRRKGELLAAKIYCFRAGVLYRMGKYPECLEDCNAAIEIWKQHDHHPSSSGSASGFQRAVRAKSVMSSKAQNVVRKGKLSHKHLYLLRGRALAAMGRYKEAAGWLTHPSELPFQKFHGSSQLLENDGIMYRVVHEIVTRDTGASGNAQQQQQQKQKQQQQQQQRPTRPGIKNVDETNNLQKLSATKRQTNIRIPTNKKLWSHVLHSVDRRLTRGTAALDSRPLRSDKATNNSSSISSGSSSSAIYQILRHGPVLFHHFEE
mmetsp:Transcript_3502/g.9823  ORF Transcript_3502/g.9823 Transcript_3502/m.9823 type:complete len:571 (-) Transcript_3502:1414-3126(-)|eukprot:CAMPEP_0172370360 /NCGR_PEP_ID=MMETSP1060-20121228/37278_1 /TAXON_ID=37318 /ORGANISM="Pseudo-nitzschia pungens, Strain cf. cingulata" /LENGTH=570 /DNA_ID=CAMNT_0013095597 /DNA_START=305 /DNA_END=2017 /DNA_ORIENTATION=-